MKILIHMYVDCCWLLSVLLNVCMLFEKKERQLCISVIVKKLIELEQGIVHK